MTDTELRLAIDQAWAHTQKTGPGPRLREAEEHLTHLRAVQASRAAHFEVRHGPPEDDPPTTEWIGGLPTCK